VAANNAEICCHFVGYTKLVVLGKVQWPVLYMTSKKWHQKRSTWQKASHPEWLPIGCLRRRSRSLIGLNLGMCAGKFLRWLPYCHLMRLNGYFLILETYLHIKISDEFGQVTDLKPWSLLIWNLYLFHCTIYLSAHYHISIITTTTTAIAIIIIIISIFLAATSWHSCALNIYNKPQNYALYWCMVNDTSVCKVTLNSCWYLGNK